MSTTTMATDDNPFATNDTFEDQVFTGVELTHADLSNKEFTRCTFRKVTLVESRWAHTRLEDCVFEGCDLTRMQPAKLSLRGVELIGCRLMGVDWSDLTPNPAVAFEDCNLQYSSFISINLTGTRFRRCKAVEVNFIETRLVESDFGDSDLTASRFEHCDLRKANFAAARGCYFDPAKNKTKDARVNLATAVLLAVSFGLRVSGFSAEPSP